MRPTVTAFCGLLLCCCQCLALSHEFKALRQEVELLKRAQLQDRRRIGRLERHCRPPPSQNAAAERNLRETVRTLHKLDKDLSRHPPLRRRREAGNFETKLEAFREELLKMQLIQARQWPALSEKIAKQDEEMQVLSNLTLKLASDLARGNPGDRAPVVSKGQADELYEMQAEVARLNLLVTDLQNYQRWDDVYTHHFQSEFEKMLGNITAEVGELKAGGCGGLQGRDCQSDDPKDNRSYPSSEEKPPKSSDRKIAAGKFRELQLQFDSLNSYVAALQRKTASHADLLRQTRADISSLQRDVSAIKSDVQSLRETKADVGVVQMAVRKAFNVKKQLGLVIEAAAAESAHVNSTLERHGNAVRLIRRESADVKQVADEARAVCEVVRGVQGEHFAEIQSFSSDLNLFETDLLRFGVKLTTLQADFLNSSLRQYHSSEKDYQQDRQISRLDVKVEHIEDNLIANAYTELKNLQRDVAQTVDQNDWNALNKDVSELTVKLTDHGRILLNLTEEGSFTGRALSRLETKLPHDCSKVRTSGIYLLKPSNCNTSAFAYCESSSDGAAWTILQRRINGTVNFNKTWQDYARGFGSVAGEHWLGNQITHSLTAQWPYELRVEVRDIYNSTWTADYRSFALGSSEEQFSLKLADFAGGNLSDALEGHNGMAFSAFDRDFDAGSTHCARYYAAGWWYSHCQRANLNGNYLIGMIWYQNSTNSWLQLRQSTMKIRPKQMVIH